MIRKIKIRKLRGKWYVFIPGDIPEISRHEWWTDALAKAQFEIREQRKPVLAIVKREMA